MEMTGSWGHELMLLGNIPSEVHLSYFLRYFVLVEYFIDGVDAWDKQLCNNEDDKCSSKSTGLSFSFVYFFFLIFSLDTVIVFMELLALF